VRREDLEKTHPVYDSFIDEWRFYAASYFGGRIYRQGDYLLQHPFESSANYRRRRETSYYYNYCGPVVDIMVSHLFRHDAQRDYGSLAGDALFEDFRRDADLEGNSFRHFIRDAQRFAAVYGRVSIIVDRPRSLAATRAESMERGIRPYAALITPEYLTDWSYTHLDTGHPVLDMVKIKEGGKRFRIWRRDEWELWEMQGDDAEPLLVDSGWHGLGEVPIVNLYNKRSGLRMLGVSDIQDIADINRNIYYLCSDAREIIENTAFPMLALPYGMRNSAENKEVGPHNIIQFDPSEPNARPYWLEAPHSSLSEIREWVRQDISEIYRIARMGGVKAVEDFRSARSGVALELEYQQLYAALSEKADNLEMAENKVLGLWAKWEGMEFDGAVDYPDDFSLKDITNDMERALSAQSARVDSRTFRKEMQKRIVDAALPKLDAQTRTAVYKEIEDAEGPGVEEA